MARAHSTVWDEETKRRDAINQRVARHKQDVINWCEAQESNCVWLNDKDFLGVDNIDKQMGRAMWHTEFEQRLARILPENIRFIENSSINSAPHHRNFRTVGFFNANGSWHTISPYEKGLLPERSLIKVRETEVRDASVWHLNRKDTPRAEWVPGQGYVFDERDARPGWKKVWEPYGEAKRGWRTVLIKLVREGYLTPARVEQHFGPDDTRSWAVHMGKRDGLVLPW